MAFVGTSLESSPFGAYIDFMKSVTSQKRNIENLEVGLFQTNSRSILACGAHADAPLSRSRAVLVPNPA